MRIPERRDRARCRVFFCGTERSSDRRQGLYGTEFTYKFVSEVEKKSGGKAVGEMGYQTYSDSAENAVAQWQGGAQSPQRPTVFLRLGAFLQRRRTE